MTSHALQRAQGTCKLLLSMYKFYCLISVWIEFTSLHLCPGNHKENVNEPVRNWSDTDSTIKSVVDWWNMQVVVFLVLAQVTLFSGVSFVTSGCMCTSLTTRRTWWNPWLNACRRSFMVQFAKLCNNVITFATPHLDLLFSDCLISLKWLIWPRRDG